MYSNFANIFGDLPKYSCFSALIKARLQNTLKKCVIGIPLSNINDYITNGKNIYVAAFCSFLSQFGF